MHADTEPSTSPRPPAQSATTPNAASRAGTCYEVGPGLIGKKVPSPRGYLPPYVEGYGAVDGNVRVSWPGDQPQMDFEPDRLTINVDQSENITSAACG
ncbi:I78 family peptidase inhibitor [Streptomyces sp. NPDC058867]|uniref:I78 family peptidase inhibitor n=1 Tax=unclassified Streptomyces TaxID=2593676 RepID=UPI00369B51D8